MALGGLNAGSAYIAVKPDMRGFSSGVKGGLRASEGEADRAGRNLGSRMTSSFKRTLKVGAVVSAGLAVAAGGKFLKDSIKQASDLGESINAVNVTFGKNAAGIKKLGQDAANNLGLSKSEFNGLAVQFSAFTETIAGKGGNVVGTMKDLTTRGADFASVMNLEVNEAMGIFQSGLAGETEPLRKFGIDLSAAAVTSHAYSEGIAEQGKKLTENQKVQARYSLLMKQTSKTQGDFKNTSDSLANSQRILGARWDDIQAKVGSKLIPALEKFSGWVLKTALPALSKFGGWFQDEITPRLKEFGDYIKGTVLPKLREFGDYIRDTVVPKIKELGGWLLKNKDYIIALGGGVLAAVAAFKAIMFIKRVITLFKLARAAVLGLNAAMRANPIGLVVTVIGLLVAGLVLAYKKSDTFRKIVDKAWAGIKKAVKVAWDNVIKPAFKAMWWYIENVLIPVYKFLWNKVVKPVMGWIGDKIKDAWNKVIKPVFNALKSFIQDKVAPGFRKGVDAIASAWDKIKSAAAKPINFVINTVYNNGIRAAFNKIADFLGSSARLPYVSPVGGGSYGSTGSRSGGAQAYGGASRIPRRLLGDAAGGPIDWIKGLGSKATGWVKDKFGGMVNGLLSKVGKSPLAQLAGASMRRVANLATDWLGEKFSAHKQKQRAASKGKALGAAGPGGRVLPAGSYRIGMPYLGYPGHYGADYPAATGTPVYSPWPGNVVATYDLPGSNPYNSTPYRSYGRVVKVQHDNGIQTLYAHLSSRIGSTGRIGAGTMIGRVGSNGNSTGPHLHFEARRGGSVFNPASLGLFDRGGLLRSGGMAVNLSGRNERILDPRTTANFERLTRALDAGSRRARTQVGPNVARQVAGQQVTQHIYEVSDPHTTARESARQFVWAGRV